MELLMWVTTNDLNMWLGLSHSMEVYGDFKFLKEQGLQSDVPSAKVEQMSSVIQP